MHREERAMFLSRVWGHLRQRFPDEQIEVKEGYSPDDHQIFDVVVSVGKFGYGLSVSDIVVRYGGRTVDRAVANRIIYEFERAMEAVTPTR